MHVYFHKLPVFDSLRQRNSNRWYRIFQYGDPLKVVDGRRTSQNTARISILSQRLCFIISKKTSFWEPPENHNTINNN